MRISPQPPPRGPVEDAVRTVLQRWDPIGSIGLGGPEDEYDDLVQPVLAALTSGATAEELASDLPEVLRTDYGMVRSERECLSVARQLRSCVPTGPMVT